MITRFVKNLVESINAKTPAVVEERQDAVVQADAEQEEGVNVRTRIKAGYSIYLYQ